MPVQPRGWNAREARLTRAGKTRETEWLVYHGLTKGSVGDEDLCRSCEEQEKESQRKDTCQHCLRCVNRGKGVQCDECDWWFHISWHWSFSISHPLLDWTGLSQQPATASTIEVPKIVGNER
ncbi:hypothetical protein E2C01_012159 [Portunus trituberculatus]|uniref:Uncharacterized protein n=1 Tax=Portunus trituberculatus TaxID=210409 RepID=A0A5B7DDE7_PORTR|nr:hypothetical protein [Portunus trituberculatus]